ncbi:NAD(P)-dependent oxidoreductase [Blastomonas sp. AAP53]|uniref:NAD(P)-dependent oxidoreductase n=1 Tax=Blastomonas sp. AAP53 TaxID=1248760 RepID=UPI0002DCC107|nr:NAD(P)-dependent oxidoreductase [Blastomonas sp. AAP53]
MTSNVTFIGFGEAGRAFAPAGVRAFDFKAHDTATRPDMLAAFASSGVEGFDDPAEALSQAQVVLCLVTADQAVAAARDYAPMLPKGALWLDMNSVAPSSKRRAAALIEAAGGRYADVAVMAPVLPQRLGVPLLVAGPHADAAATALQASGFAKVSIAGENVGEASAIKMIRSVMVKGLEALTTECALAAERAGVSDAVIASLDASWKDQSWGQRFDYNLDRMMAHGLRRAAEMEEVAVTLSDLGVDPVMTRGTIERQRAIGALAVSPPEGLAAKLAAIQTPEPASAA